jgi:hypothetical protein
MATLSETVSATGPKFSPPAKTVGVLSNIVTLGTTDVGTKQEIIIGYLPPMSKVIDVVLGVTDVDSGTAFVCAVGDTSDPDRFINGGTIGQAAGVLRAGNNATSAKTYCEHTGYTAATPMSLSVITEAGTAAVGTAVLTFTYETLEPPTA